MLKKHKNAFLRVIEESGLEPTLFYSEEQIKENMGFFAGLGSDAKLGQPAFIIGLKDTPLRFVLRESYGSFDKLAYKFTEFKPGFRSNEWTRDTDIPRVLIYFKNWLKDVVKRYLEDSELPDYWAQLREYQAIVVDSGTSDSESADFTQEEKESVRRGINRFRQLVKENFKPTPTQEGFINERLDHLVAAVDKLSRFDWRGVALSTLVTIAANLAVDTERGRLLYTLFQQAFQEATKFLK
jgi:hypothetical protein